MTELTTDPRSIRAMPP